MDNDAGGSEVRSARPPGWEFAGAYLVTLVSREEALFGRVAKGRMALSEAGGVVAEEWQRLSGLVAGVWAGEVVVMPNHVHGIIYLAAGSGKKGRRGGRRRRCSDAALLGAAITRLKAAVTRRANARRGAGAGSVWRAGYRQVVVESAQELAAVRRLIRENPARWAEDVENPARQAAGAGPRQAPA